jgi:NTP pyrophosphatase (non-canonical NTP hydrolase)
MRDDQDGIQQKASAIANESVAKSGEIVEGAQQALGGDVREGVAKILKAAGQIATGATEKGLEIAAEVVDKTKERNETGPTETP